MAVFQLDEYREPSSSFVRRTAPSRQSAVQLCECSTHTAEPSASARGGALSQWLARARYRNALRRELLPQPDSVLADFGVTREEAEEEAYKPFWRA